MRVTAGLTVHPVMWAKTNLTKYSTCVLNVKISLKAAVYATLVITTTYTVQNVIMTN